MEKYQYFANELFVKTVINSLLEEGVWMWPDIQERYSVINGKLKPETKRGEKKLKEIVRKEFYNNNCVSL
jgi:hypothetical protein